MEKEKLLFLNMPDTVFITDAYGYILDFNRPGPFPSVKKGKKLKSLIPDGLDEAPGAISVGRRIFRRQTSPILRSGEICGYTVLLTDVTDEVRLTEELRKASEELDKLIGELEHSNQELENYALQVKALTDYAEQLRIAQVIHDDAGHAITELHTICEMCLRLKDSDPDQTAALLEEGIDICRRALDAKEDRKYDSLESLLRDFAHICRIRTEWSVSGAEPAYLQAQFPLIRRILKEAYHNTLDHSLADTIFITAELSEQEARIRIRDNGSFRGEFEKGFGLQTMEDNVQRSGGDIQFIAETGKGFEIDLIWRKTV